MWIHSVFTYLYVSVRISRELTRTSSCYYLVFISLMSMMESVAVVSVAITDTTNMGGFRACRRPPQLRPARHTPQGSPRPMGSARSTARSAWPAVCWCLCDGRYVACRRLNLRYYSTCALYICTLYPTPGYVSGSVFERIWSRGWIRCVSYVSVRIPSVFNMQDYEKK